MNLPNLGFNEEQQQYLSGFVTGALHRQKVPFLGQTASGQFTNDPMEAEHVYGTAIDDLCKEEQVKHEQHGLDSYSTILENAKKGIFPESGDTFRYKFYGLFHVTPAQNSFMLRARIPGCAMRSHQLKGFADIAEHWGGGYSDITTRGNLQVREIMPENCVKVLDQVVDLGLTSRGAGADNVRNITATPTSGFDPHELYDVLPLAKSMHHYILNNRDLYGLPRKFNIAFDSGGAVSVCADTNDIAFYATELKEAQGDLQPGVYFRMQLCGITGHKQFATDTGILLTPDETIVIAAAILRVFIENGDRTNRKKARLKYLVDQWGIQKTLEETERKLTFPLRYVPLEKCVPPRPKSKHGHIGEHLQKDRKYYLGVVIPVGRMPAKQMRQIAEIADQYGSGDIRLTAWQNMIIPDIDSSVLAAAKKAVIDAGLHYQSSSVSGGLIACTGNTGCKFAAANTKGQSVQIAQYLEQKIKLDHPINIHLTGCPHSCAQHYIGDIGMQGVKVKNAQGENVEGYNIVLGGGVDDTQAIAKEVFKAVPFDKVAPLLEHVLSTYLDMRVSEETFVEFTARYNTDELKKILTPSLLSV